MHVDRKPNNKEFTTTYYTVDVHEILASINGEERYAAYRAEWDKASSLEYVPEYPLQLDFELNYSCNFSCPMCTWSVESTSGKGKKTWFSFDVYKQVVDDGIKKGLKAIRFNYINEPLMRKDIVKYVQYAKDLGVIDTYFSTNGSLLNDEMSIALIESGLDRLQISIDAYTQETFDKIRVGGDLKKITKNIHRFIELRNKLKRRTPILRVNFVKTADNIDELENFIAYWDKFADGIGVQNLISIISDKDSTPSAKGNAKFKCAQPFYHMTIRYNGDVLPCCAFYGAEMPVAKLKIENKECFSDVDNLAFDKNKQSELIISTIGEIWNGENMKFLRNIHNAGEYWKHPVCNKCVLNSSHMDETVEL